MLLPKKPFRVRVLLIFLLKAFENLNLDTVTQQMWQNCYTLWTFSDLLYRIFFLIMDTIMNV